MDIQVLGTSCCGNADAAAALIEEVARSKGIGVRVEKVADLRTIAAYGVISTPGIVVGGKVVHAGGLPTREKIERWLADASLS